MYVVNMVLSSVFLSSSSILWLSILPYFPENQVTSTLLTMKFVFLKIKKMVVYVAINIPVVNGIWSSRHSSFAHIIEIWISFPAFSSYTCKLPL
uniref:Putative ovule protein n=1 Tax=Solanum chacoense TaxID=4108 RepID=A0A0V0HPF9_SOLCH